MQYAAIHNRIFKGKPTDFMKEEQKEELYNPFIQEFSFKMNLDDDDDMSGKQTSASYWPKVKA